MTPAERLQAIRTAMDAAFPGSRVEVTDESHLHAGHPGARDGRGHFRVAIHSNAFIGQRPLARHRMVYAALGALMQTDIHAVAIDARAPGEGAVD